MVHRSFMSTGIFEAIGLLTAIVATTLGGIPAVASAAETDPAAALPANHLLPPPQKMLLPRDCLQCAGPAPGAPCLDTHRGFLYYGSYPWDDDPFNGFDDCPGGRCGRPGAALSLGWIGIHNAKAVGVRHHACHHGHYRNSHHGHASCSSCNAVPRYPLGRLTPEHVVTPEPARAWRPPVAGSTGETR